MSNSESLVGKPLGNYDIVEMLGKGGMATVYLGTQRSIKRTVAVKVLPHSMMHDDTFMQRFRREAELIASLEHFHILPIFDYGELEGMPYIVMRYLDGGTLKDRIMQGPLPWVDIVRITGQIGSALDYAHKRSVVHRDIKPSNILLDADGNAYLADFGIAKIQEGGTQLTGSGMIGTPAYMAPEQSSSNAPAPSMDIYALGVTLFEMITGQVPYQSDTPIGQILMHLQEPVPSLVEINPDIPESVDSMVRRAMAKSPDQRFQSCAELAQAMEAATSDNWGWNDDTLARATSTLSGASRNAPTAGVIQGVDSVTSAPSPAAAPAPASRRSTGGGGMAIWYAVGAVALLIVIGAIIGILVVANNRNTQAAETQATAIARQTQQAVSVVTTEPEVSPTVTANAASAEPTATVVEQVAESAEPVEPTATGVAPSVIPTELPGTTTLRGIPMALIPGGSFIRGRSDGSPDERPEREVFLSAYYIDETEVTNLYWAACVNEGVCAEPEFTGSPSRFSYYGTDVYKDYPVLYISWTEAQEYCNWRGGHLPTEAQWEKAARYDPDTDTNRTFPWAETVLDPFYLNYSSLLGDTTSVYEYPGGVSALGVYDMAGNVAEWVFDWYQDNYYELSPLTDPPGPDSGSLKVYRGGSFESRGDDLTTTARAATGPETRLATVGFRCAFTPSGDPTEAVGN